ncbi:hypothetical protein [Flavobacterium chungbukense]|uniref:Right handed beta helix domain-containing protein n=1 Tax=Flavobacterium chungbukense TaxID=877464 RepID=A0ABP7YIY6_9FLAO|nr:hypothetical protein [Flavobacterium chungbukense]MCC4920171.1 hypothetical protein [Flavobacterium chungbukense]
MKHLIYFLLLSVSGFSQNYHYAIDEAPVKSPVSPVADNQPEEIEYFNAYLLPISQKASIQSALDQYGSVRLEKGNYSGISIVLKSNQRLFGHPTLNTVTGIRIASGSTNVKVQNITATAPSGIYFEAGAPITNSEFKNIESTPITSTGGMIENNSFINLSRCVLKWDMSSSGYFRNNKIIKHRIHAYYPQIVMKGNSTTPSYGNVQLWINMLTPGGNGAEIDNVKTLTWVGVDSESWNFNNYSSKALIEMKNMGDVRIAAISGGNLISTPTPVFDIAANNLLMSRKFISAAAAGNSTLRANTNMFILDSNSEGYNIDKASTGFDFKGRFNGSNVALGGVNLTAALTDTPTISKLTNTILGAKKTPWERPVFDPIPNPTGDNWATERAGKTDQKNYIQDLINKNGIAELTEGTYYIGSTLTIKNNQGIIGKGTGKTIIVGLKDDFPLITAVDVGPSEVKCYLSNMTLQGGLSGLRMSYTSGGTVQWSACIFKYLVFRNQKYGIHFDKGYGFDNNFIEHISFVNTTTGVYQETDPAYSGGETPTMMYIDKVVFYKCQWLNNTKALSLISARASNLNAWIDCNFDNNGTVADIKYYNSPFFANCTFTNNKGDYVIGGENTVEFYSCLFEKNTAAATFKLYGAYLEGCTILDNVSLFKNYTPAGFITNSTITGNVGSLTSGMIVNSSIPASPTFNKLLVNINAAKPTTIIEAAPNPYPQLLVTQ